MGDLPPNRCFDALRVVRKRRRRRAVGSASLPTSCGTVGPNSVAKPARRWPAPRAASRSVAASAASFFPSGRRIGRTASGAIGSPRARPVSTRAQWWGPPRLQHHHAGVPPLEEPDQSAPAQLASDRHFFGLAHGMDLGTDLAASKPLDAVLVMDGFVLCRFSGPRPGTPTPSTGRSTRPSRRLGGFAGRQPRVICHDGPAHLVLDGAGLQPCQYRGWPITEPIRRHLRARSKRLSPSPRSAA